MILLTILLLSLIVYYLGLSYLTTVAFKKRKIKISISLSLFLPFYIFKTYFLVMRNHWSNKRIRKKVLLDMIFGYDSALIILIEVVYFGFEKGLLISAKKRKKRFDIRLSSLKNSSMKNNFSKNMEIQLAHA